MKTLIFLILLILEVVADGETNKEKRISLSKSLNLNPIRKQRTSEISGSKIGVAQTEDNEEEKIRIRRGEDQQEVKLFEEIPPKEEDSLNEDSVDEFPLKDKLLRDGPMAVFNAEDGVALRAKRQMGCTAEFCKGDQCYTGDFYYPGDDQLFLRRGCVIGSQVADGCRTNQHGNTLCLCNSDGCNQMSNITSTMTNLLIPSSQPTMLPLQTCGRRSVDGTIPPRWRRACAANYCTFSATPYAAENLTSTWLETNCSHFSDFDVYSHESVFLVYPNSCARLQFGGINETTICYGTSSLPYDAAYEAAAPGVVCHVDYYSPNLPYVRAGTECRGQYCFISATVQGDVYRGCATVYQDPTETRVMAVGFYRSYNAIEQWLCQSDYCNYDLRAAERSWPDTLAPYRNISHLQQFNVFYVINEDKSCPPFLGVTLAIAGLIISSAMVN